MIPSVDLDVNFNPVRSDPYNVPPDDAMEFRLVYGGLLYGASRTDTRSSHKNDVRKVFHQQLKHLWNVAPKLREWMMGNPWKEVLKARDYLAKYHKFNGTSMVPLVTDGLGVGLKLDILMLRPDQPGMTLMQSGDIDNRLKTIFDALRLPQIGEVFDAGGEEPFFCLMQNDSTVNHVAVTTDLLLGDVDVNEVRLIITVTIWPIVGTIQNMGVF